jgi:hypothetical protein
MPLRFNKRVKPRTDNIAMNFERIPVRFACRFRWYPWVVCCLLFGLIGCQTNVVPPYDPEIDRTATALQKKMDGFLTGLETHTGHPQADYTWNAAFYDDYLVELRSLYLRAQSYEHDEAMAKQVKEMMENLQQLRLAHEGSPLNPNTIQATRDLFNQGWRAIIAQELAKRRR